MRQKSAGKPKGPAADKQAIAPKTPEGKFAADQVSKLGFPDPSMPKEIVAWPEDLSMVDGPMLSKLLTQCTALRNRAKWLAVLVENDLNAYEGKAKSLESEKLAFTSARYQGESVTEMKARANADPAVRSLKVDANHARYIYEDLKERAQGFEWQYNAVSREISRRAGEIED